MFGSKEKRETADRLQQMEDNISTVVKENSRLQRQYDSLKRDFDSEVRTTQRYRDEEHDRRLREIMEPVITVKSVYHQLLDLAARLGFRENTNPPQPDLWVRVNKDFVFPPQAVAVPAVVDGDACGCIAPRRRT